MNSENISQNLDAASSQAKKIFKTISEVKKLEAKGENSNIVVDEESLPKVSKKMQDVIFKIDNIDHKITTSAGFKGGSQNNKINCNSTVIFDLEIYSKNKLLFSKKNNNIRVSENKNILIERKVLGVYSGKMVEFVISDDYEFLDSLFRKFWLENGSIKIKIGIKRVLDNSMFQSNKSNRFICS